MKNNFSLIISTILTSILIVFLTIYSELNESFKNYIASFTTHHWISNSILAETIGNFNEKIKEYLSKNNDDEIFKNYMQGYLAGDGNFFSNRDKNGSLHSRLSLYEESEVYINQHKEILDRYGLNGKIRKDKNKNLFRLIITSNWSKLLILAEYDLFSYIPHHKKRLMWAIKQHNKFRSLKYLINLEKRFDYKALQRITQKGESYTRGWLLKRRREGIIEKEKERVWKLTEEGQRIKNILHNIQAMENEARDLDAVQNKL